MYRNLAILNLLLAGYNAGPNAVKNMEKIPPYKETQNYVEKFCKTTET